MVLTSPSVKVEGEESGKAAPLSVLQVRSIGNEYAGLLAKLAVPSGEESQVKSVREDPSLPYNEMDAVLDKAVTSRMGTLRVILIKFHPTGQKYPFLVDSGAAVSCVHKDWIMKHVEPSGLRACS